MKFRVAIQMPDESFDVDVSGIYLTPKSNRKEDEEKLKEDWGILSSTVDHMVKYIKSGRDLKDLDLIPYLKMYDDFMGRYSISMSEKIHELMESGIVKITNDYLADITNKDNEIFVVHDVLKVRRGHGDMPLDIESRKDNCVISNVHNRINNRELSNEKIRRNLLTGRIVAKVPYEVARSINARILDEEHVCEYLNYRSLREESKNKSNKKLMMSIYTVIPE